MINDEYITVEKVKEYRERNKLRSSKRTKETTKPRTAHETKVSRRKRTGA